MCTSIHIKYTKGDSSGATFWQFAEQCCWQQTTTLDTRDWGHTCGGREENDNYNYITLLGHRITFTSLQFLLYAVYQLSRAVRNFLMLHNQTTSKYVNHKRVEHLHHV